MTRFVLARAAVDRGDDTVVIATEPWPGRRGAFAQRGAVRAYFTPMQLRILRVLATQGHIFNEDMLDIVYGDCLDGGPLAALGVVRVMLLKMRKALGALGLRIETRYGQGIWLRG